MVFEIEVATNYDAWYVYARKSEYEEFRDKLKNGEQYIEIEGLFGESICVKSSDVISVNARKLKGTVHKTISHIQHPVLNDLIDMHISEHEMLGYRHLLTLSDEGVVELIFSL